MPDDPFDLIRKLLDDKPPLKFQPGMPFNPPRSSKDKLYDDFLREKQGEWKPEDGAAKGGHDGEFSVEDVNDITDEDIDFITASTLSPQVSYTQVRNAILAGRISPARGVDSSMVVGFDIAVNSGRVFDMGTMPNAAIIREGDRARKLFVAGHIDHPFGSRDPNLSTYALFHRWEGGSSLYMVDAMRWANTPVLKPTTMMVSEAVAYIAEDNELSMLVTGHITMTYFGGGSGGADDNVAIHHTMSPLNLRTDEAMKSFTSNIMQPVLATMLLLSTEGIDHQRHTTNDKVNKRRVKDGKRPIPEHYAINTGPYITALTMTHAQRKALHQGGTHASPVPHLRRGHIRNLNAMHGGGTTWVRDALVNLRDPTAPLTRSFYSIQRGIK